MSVFSLSRAKRMFSRITVNTQFIPVVDGLRFIAIISVLVFHINQFYAFNGPLRAQASNDALFHLLNIGEFGVQLFFILSGFILILPFAQHHLADANPISLRRYFWRRFTRLEAPYVISLLIYFYLHWLASGKALFSDLLLSLFYLNQAFHQLSKINYVTWSLEIEAQFYLLVPLLATVFAIRSRFARRLLLIVAAAGFGWIKTFIHPEPFWCFLDYVQYFLVGMLLCEFYITVWKLPSRCPQLWDVVGLAAWGFLSMVLVRQLWVPLLAPLCASFAYAAAFRGQYLSKILSNGWLVTIGGMCYTIYLYHILLLAVPSTIFFNRLRIGDSYALHIAVLCLILCPIVLLCSAILFSVFERPFMIPDWPRLLAGKLLPDRRKPVSLESPQR